MTIKVAVHRVCDRCQQPFDATSLNYGEELPKFPKKRIAAVLYDKDTGTDTVLFGYDDLCQECDRIVDGYIKRIRMEAADEAKPKQKTKKELKVEKVLDVAAVNESEKPPVKEARFEPEASLGAALEPEVKALPVVANLPTTEAPVVSPLPF